MTKTGESSETVHGSCIAMGGKSALLLGASGAGKSAISLDLISRGAGLVADDQVVLTRENGAIKTSCLEGFSGQIEARGIGILSVNAVDQAELALIVDLDQTELQRLPPVRKREILGLEFPLIYGRDNWHLSAGIAALLRRAKVA